MSLVDDEGSKVIEERSDLLFLLKDRGVLGLDMKEDDPATPEAVSGDVFGSSMLGCKREAEICRRNDVIVMMLLLLS